MDSKVPCARKVRPITENLVYGSPEFCSIQALHFIYKKLYCYEQYLEDGKHTGVSRK